MNGRSCVICRRAEGPDEHFTCVQPHALCPTCAGVVIKEAFDCLPMTFEALIDWVRKDMEERRRSRDVPERPDLSKLDLKDF